LAGPIKGEEEHLKDGNKGRKGMKDAKEGRKGRKEQRRESILKARR
jgi:hypothetical protein